MNRRFSRMPATSALVALVPLLLASACATPMAGRSSGPDNAAGIREQLFKLQKDSARLLTKIEQMEQAGFSTDLRATCAEAVSRMDEVERRVGALEEQTLATHSRVDEALVELRAMRRGGNWSAGSTGDTGAASGWPDSSRSSGSVTGGATAIPSNMAPEDLFNSAYADYSRGKYDLALAGFEGARNSDPAGPLADDAQYWTGETLYAMGRHLESSTAFGKVISDYGTGDKVQPAHLKRGLALVEARRTAEGVMELQYVIETWPDSDEARIAQEYFKRKGIVQD